MSSHNLIQYSNSDITQEVFALSRLRCDSATARWKSFASATASFFMSMYSHNSVVSEVALRAIASKGGGGGGGRLTRRRVVLVQS